MNHSKTPPATSIWNKDIRLPLLCLVFVVGIALLLAGRTDTAAKLLAKGFLYSAIAGLVAFVRKRNKQRQATSPTMLDCSQH